MNTPTAIDKLFGTLESVLPAARLVELRAQYERDRLRERQRVDYQRKLKRLRELELELKQLSDMQANTRRMTTLQNSIARHAAWLAAREGWR